MGKLLAIPALIAIACCAAFGQNSAAASAATPAEFEVATVRPSPAQGFSYSTGMHFDPAQVRFANMSMDWYIEWAFELQEFQLAGPNWMSSERYDITAKIPAGVQHNQLPAMMQKLLQQRFQLQYHRESKVLAAYALVVAGGGLRIHLSQTAQGATSQSWPGHMEVHECSVPSLAASLTGRVDRPVVDETGAPGVFDFTLDWAEDEEHEAAGLPSIRAALQERLALKLEPRKLPVEMLVIDRIDRKPTEN